MVPSSFFLPLFTLILIKYWDRSRTDVDQQGQELFDRRNSNGFFYRSLLLLGFRGQLQAQTGGV